MDKFYLYLREEFQKNLSTKTNWGRVEVIIAFDKAYVVALSRYAREKGVDLT